MTLKAAYVIPSKRDRALYTALMNAVTRFALDEIGKPLAAIGDIVEPRYAAASSTR